MCLVIEDIARFLGVAERRVRLGCYRLTLETHLMKMAKW